MLGMTMPSNLSGPRAGIRSRGELWPIPLQDVTRRASEPSGHDQLAPPKWVVVSVVV
ncbi:hypothetical protein [Xylanimonas sp. McL0601]|uniref:hypothetical protein n=1 Tax=Xylanimonas sp. McL0601 TaxID=3414739 RepID=UPI003CEE9ACD